MTEPSMTITGSADNGNFRFEASDQIGDGQAHSPWYDPYERPSRTVTSIPQRLREADPEDLVVNTGRDWKEGGGRDDAQRVPLTDPAPAIDGKGRWHLETKRDFRDGEAQQERDLEQPSPTISGGGKQLTQWEFVEDKVKDLSLFVGRHVPVLDTADLSEFELDALEPPLDTPDISTWDGFRFGDFSQGHGAIRDQSEPAPTITSTHRGGGFAFREGEEPPTLNPGRTDTQPNRRVYGPEEPAPTLAFGHDAASWAWERPATTLAGDPRIGAPVHHRDAAQPDAPPRTANAVNIASVQAGDYDGQHAIRLQVGDALVLQSFDRDYPVRGSKTKQFEGVGNAIPPVWAAAVLRELL